MSVNEHKLRSALPYVGIAEEGVYLVKLRRLDQDHQKSHKLEPRWEGPYLIERVSAHGRSV